VTRTELLGADLHEKTRWQRVRWILALDEVARLGRAATWEEWNKTWFGGQRYTATAAKKALTRLCSDLRELGVELLCSEGRFVDGRGRELRALIEPWLERARRLEREIEERRRRKRGSVAREREDSLGDDDVGEYVVLDPDVVVAEYRNMAKSINEIGHLHRVGSGRVSKILHAKGVVRERNESRSLESTRPAELLESALAAFDLGATGPEVARILACGTGTAWRFLRRNGRQRDKGARFARPHVSRT